MVILEVDLDGDINTKMKTYKEGCFVDHNEKPLDNTKDEKVSHGNQIDYTMFTDSGKYLFSCSCDSKIKQWSVADGQVTILNKHPTHFKSFCILKKQMKNFLY